MMMSVASALSDCGSVGSACGSLVGLEVTVSGGDDDVVVVGSSSPGGGPNCSCSPAKLNLSSRSSGSCGSCGSDSCLSGNSVSRPRTLWNKLVCGVQWI